MKNWKHLFAQLVKFGIVGVLATLIDWVIFYLLTNIINIHYGIATAISFLISTVFNYYLSVKYVFDVDSSTSKKRNFVIFLIFSIIGLGLNELILWICIEKIRLYNMIGKIIATGLVMIFNFITRKIFLEKSMKIIKK